MSKRLLQRNTRYLLTWLPVVLMVCLVAFYILLRMQSNHMQEKQLLLKQRNVWAAFTRKSGNMENRVEGEYDIQEAGVNRPTIYAEPRDTSIYYAHEQKMLPFQKLSGQFVLNEKNYIVTTYVSSTEI